MNRRKALLIGITITATAVVVGGFLWQTSPSAGSRKTGSRQPAVDNAPPLASAEMLRWKQRIHSAGAKDFEPLLRGILALPANDPARADLLTAVLRQWLDQDIAGLIAFLDCEEVEGGAEIWGQLSAALAAAMISVSDATATDARLSELIRRWVEYNASESPEIALEFARKWLEGDARDASLATVVVSVASQNPDRALGIFAEIKSPVRRIDAMNGIAPALVARDPQRALRWARNLANPAEQPYAMAGVITALATSQPDVAVREAARFRGDMQTRYRHAVLTETGKPLDQFASDDPGDREVAPAAEDPQTHLLTEPLLLATEAWAGRDPYATLRWADGVPLDAMRRDLERQAFAGWAAKDPRAALAFLHVSRRDVKDGVETIFQSWGSHDPGAAAAAVADLPDDTQRVAATRGFIANWVEQDVAAAAAWTRTLPPGPVRDEAGAAVAGAIVVDDPRGAWDLALGIQDAKRRSDILGEAFATLVSVDADSARDELSVTQLTADEAKKLGQMLRTSTGETP